MAKILSSVSFELAWRTRLVPTWRLKTVQANRIRFFPTKAHVASRQISMEKSWIGVRERKANGARKTDRRRPENGNCCWSKKTTGFLIFQFKNGKKRLFWAEKVATFEIFAQNFDNLGNAPYIHKISLSSPVSLVLKSFRDHSDQRYDCFVVDSIKEKFVSNIVRVQERPVSIPLGGPGRSRGYGPLASF